MNNKAVLAVSMCWMLTGIARAAEPETPPLKEGLWESHTQQLIGKEKFMSVMKLCRTHAFDKSLKESSKAAGENMRKRDQCTVSVTVPTANSYVSEMHCEKDKSVTRVTMTFQGDTSYHMEQHSQHGQSESVTIVDDRYVGGCPADMKPGDMVTPDGKKMNMGSP